MANEGYPVLGSNADVSSASGVAALAKRGLLEKSGNYKFWVLAALIVRHMWDVYTYSKTIRLPRLWPDAFRAGYESLVSDAPLVRDAAVTPRCPCGALSLIPLLFRTRAMTARP